MTHFQIYCISMLDNIRMLEDALTLLFGAALLGLTYAHQKKAVSKKKFLLWVKILTAGLLISSVLRFFTISTSEAVYTYVIPTLSIV